MEQKQFNPGELQAIERMAMAFELAVTNGDPEKCAIETKRAIALIDAKRNPAKFIRQIIEKARQYESEI